MDIQDNISPTLLVRPRPSYMRDPAAPIKLGGKPQLPATHEWPEGLTFYAQIDLRLAPRSIEIDGQVHPLDLLPKEGTLFVFLPLDGDRAYGTHAKVIYCAEDVSGLPERDPPEDLGDLRADEANWASYWVDTVGLSLCGRLLHRQEADLLPIVTATSPGELWANMMEAEDHPEWRAQYDAAQALAKRVNGEVAEAYPIPPLPDGHRLIQSKQAEGFRADVSWLRDTRPTWDFIFEFSRSIVEGAKFLGFKTMQLYLKDPEETEQLDLLKLFLAKLQDEWKAVRAMRRAPKPGRNWATMFGGPKIPKKGRFDEQAQGWMDYAQTQTGEVSDALSTRFWDFAEAIATYKSERGAPLNIGPIDDWLQDHQMNGRDTQELCRSALKAAKEHLVLRAEAEQRILAADKVQNHAVLKASRDPAIATAYWDAIAINAWAKLGKPEERRHSFGSRHNTQLLGAPNCVQPSVEDYAQSNVLLMQIEADNGMQVAPPDGNFQLWITPEDLAASQFDKVHYTYVFS